MALFDGVTFRERIGKVTLLVFAFCFLFCFSFSASAQDCTSQAQQDVDSCNQGVKNPSNNTGGCQQGQNMPGGGGAQSQVAGTGAQGVQQGINNCNQKKNDCDTTCKNDAQQAQQQNNPGLASANYKAMQNCDSQIASALTQANAALASLTQGATGAASSAAASTGGSGAQSCGGDSKPPPMPPPPPPSPASSPQPAPTPMPAPTPSPSASTCAIGDTTCEGQNLLNDGGLGANFFGSKPATTGTGSNIIDSTTAPTGVGTSGISPPTGGSGSTSSGSGSGGLPAGTTKSNAESTNGSGGHGNPNEGTPGSSNQIMEAGGGGSSGGAGASNSYSPLSAYLPGGAKQPSRTPAAMAIGKGAAHPDITSKHSNMFDQIRIRMELLCKMKELIGCT